MKFLENPLIMMLLMLLLITCAFLVLSLESRSTMSRVEWREETYHVKSGDSLWIISREYCPNGVNRYEWIEAVQIRNGLTSSFIYPGQRLKVLVPATEV